MSLGDVIREWWNEREIRGLLGILKDSREDCEPLHENEYFWFNYSSQGKSGPQFIYFKEEYDAAIATMKDTISQAESIIKRLKAGDHSKARLDILKKDLIPYKTHIKSYPTAASYVTYLQSHLGSNEMTHFQHGLQQRALDAQLKKYER